MASEGKKPRKDNNEREEDKPITRKELTDFLDVITEQLAGMYTRIDLVDTRLDNYHALMVKQFSKIAKSISHGRFMAKGHAEKLRSLLEVVKTETSTSDSSSHSSTDSFNWEETREELEKKFKVAAGGNEEERNFYRSLTGAYISEKEIAEEVDEQHALDYYGAGGDDDDETPKTPDADLTDMPALEGEPGEEKPGDEDMELKRILLGEENADELKEAESDVDLDEKVLLGEENEGEIEVTPEQEEEEIEKDVGGKSASEKEEEDRRLAEDAAAVESLLKTEADDQQVVASPQQLPATYDVCTGRAGCLCARCVSIYKEHLQNLRFQRTSSSPLKIKSIMKTTLNAYRKKVSFDDKNTEVKLVTRYLQQRPRGAHKAMLRRLFFIQRCEILFYSMLQCPI